jgi:hypothetical protein
MSDLIMAQQQLAKNLNVTKEIIENWLKLARRAPSADNMQPWKASYTMNDSEILMKIELNKSTLDHASEIDANYRTSIIALGAFAKNLEIIALADGFAVANISSFKNQFDITFAKATPALNPLLNWISQRATNRLPFKSEVLSAEHSELIKNIQDEMTSTRINYIARSDSKKIVNILGKLDLFRYVNKTLFFDFISKLRFRGDIQKTKDGLAGPTLGVPVMARASLAFMKQFKFLWKLNFLGIQYISAYLGATRLLQKSAGTIVLQGSKDTSLDWFNLGFDLQKVWLTLNHQGIAVQPFGTTLAIYRAHLEECQSLNNLQPQFQDGTGRKLLKLGQELKIATGLDATLPLLILRIGYPTQTPAEQSLRK